MKDNFKEGDIYRWSYNLSRLEELNDGNNGGTTYWCCSRIGVIHNGRLVDTYWGSSGSNKSFSFDLINKWLVIEFVANQKDLIPSSKEQRAYYADSDCVDLSHPNMGRGGFYLRVGATKDLAKIKRLARRNIKHLITEKAYIDREIDRLTQELKTVDCDYHLSMKKDVSLNDKCYTDE